MGSDAEVGGELIQVWTPGKAFELSPLFDSGTLANGAMDGWL